MVNITEISIQQAKWLNEATGDRHLSDGYHCPKCKNKGISYTVVKDEVVSRLCSCAAVRRSLLIINKSGLAPFIDKKTFDTFNTEEGWQRGIKDGAIEFTKENGSAFFIGGQSGSGKTHICTAICNELMKKGMPTLYFMWASEIRTLKAKANDPSYLELINPYKEIKVLYIDDFLKVTAGATPTSADMNIAFDIISSRAIDPTKITIISSELSLNKILELDEATGSRIRQGAGKFIYYIERDIRKNQRLK